MKEESKPPLAFFITFRTYGTWLHGDQRGSTNRFQNEYRSDFLKSNPGWKAENYNRLSFEPYYLSKNERKVVSDALTETCEKRDWTLHPQNVRTNHVHVVASTGTKNGKSVRTAFKANATRALREAGYWNEERSPWARKGSAKSVWDLNALGSVVDYVLNQQGDDI